MKRVRISVRMSVLALVYIWILPLTALMPTSSFGARGVVSGDDGKEDSLFKPGVYFYRLEPSFYTGFAPRCQDPKRIQIQLGRGNQLRVTVVLSDHMIGEYLSDLATRFRVYRELIDTGQITLSQNTAFEKFEHTLSAENILWLAGQRHTMDNSAYREISLEKLRKLNPGRIFHIKIDFRSRIDEWSAQLSGISKTQLTLERSLNIINGLLPTRLKISEVSPDVKKRLHAAIERYAQYQSKKEPPVWDRFYQATVDLFTCATGGIYPLQDDTLDYYEFTAIYPVGTLNQLAKYDGVQIPLYPCPGKHVLRVHQRTRVVDHVPEAASYAYLPWIPYMHVGERLHNSFHSLWFKIDTRKNAFIPEDWKQNTEDSRTGEPYTHLWLVSRGPMSHGCTHVNAGHISELRQLLPSSEATLRRVVTYRSKSNHFDVFDIDGDGFPEVMGVKYFYAYSLKSKKPHTMRVASDRKSFYVWLYKKGYYYDGRDRVIFNEATASKFIGKKAFKGKTYSNILLYEAEYCPETIQFYKPKNIRFVRELRRVSSTYNFDRKALKMHTK